MINMLITCTRVNGQSVPKVKDRGCMFIAYHEILKFADAGVCPSCHFPMNKKVILS